MPDELPCSLELLELTDGGTSLHKMDKLLWCACTLARYMPETSGMASVVRPTGTAAACPGHSLTVCSGCPARRGGKGSFLYHVLRLWPENFNKKCRTK